MKFQVDTALLSSDVKAMEGELENLRRAGESMNRAFDSLESMWGGEAHDAFVVQYRIDYQFLLSFFDSMQHEISEIRLAQEQYEKCENEARAKIASVSV